MPPSDPLLIRAVVLICALALDRFVGEYPNRWHPVVWMGSTIRAVERRAPARGAFLYGLGMAGIIPAAFAALGWIVTVVPILNVIGGVFLLK